MAQSICNCGQEFAKIQDLIGHIRHNHTNYDKLFLNKTKEYREANLTSNEMKYIVKTQLKTYLTSEYSKWIKQRGD